MERIMGLENKDDEVTVYYREYQYSDMYRGETTTYGEVLKLEGFNTLSLNHFRFDQNIDTSEIEHHKFKKIVFNKTISINEYGEEHLIWLLSAPKLRRVLIIFSLSPLLEKPLISIYKAISYFIKTNYNIIDVEFRYINTLVNRFNPEKLGKPPFYIKEEHDIIEENVKRNKKGFERCRDAALTFLNIRYRRESILDQVPKEVVKIIAKQIWETRGRECWVC